MKDGEHVNRAVEWSLAELGRKEKEGEREEREKEKRAQSGRNKGRRERERKKERKKGRRRYETDKTLIALKKRIQ